MRGFKITAICCAFAACTCLYGCVDGTENVANSSSEHDTESVTSAVATAEVQDEISETESVTSVTEENITTEISDGRLEIGSQTLRGFISDNVLHDENLGEIHFASYIPDSYSGDEKYALFITLPGWEGLYFQGLGENLKNEDFGITAQDYNEKMIVLAPQLDDWGGNKRKHDNRSYRIFS